MSEPSEYDRSIPEWRPDSPEEFLIGTVEAMKYRASPAGATDHYIRSVNGDLYRIHMRRTPVPLRIGTPVVVQAMPKNSENENPPIWRVYLWEGGGKPGYKGKWVLPGQPIKRYTPKKLAEKIGRPVEELRSASE